MRWRVQLNIRNVLDNRDLEPVTGLDDGTGRVASQSNGTTTYTSNAGYLGPDFVVESSIGHIRDLPERASEIPKAQRGKYGALGVAIDEGFEPYYVVDPGKKRVVAELKKKLKDADELLLATDEDREGEAIA